MGILHKLMPTRDDRRSTKLIADLDDLISQPIGFKYLGKSYIVEPMTTHNFMLVTRALHELEGILKTKEQQEFHEDEIYEAYFNFVSSLCPQMTLSDIKKAKIPQLHALLNLMVRHISGQTAPDMVAEDPEKKKTQILMTHDSQNSIFSRCLHSCLVSIRTVLKK
jgi:hypothetical protein